MVSTTDAKNNTSLASYDDHFSDNTPRNTYALPTSMESAIPDQSGQYGSNSRFSVLTTYDFSTGRVTALTDTNGKTTNFAYAGSLDRLQSVSSPDGGSISFTYDRTLNNGVANDYVKTSEALDGTRSVESYQFFDGMGRPVRSFLKEGSSPDVFLTRDTQYDSMGRVLRSSNPYRTDGFNAGLSGLWTAYTYDALDRVTAVTMADGSVVGTEYPGNKVTTTDQAGIKRSTEYDSLGRATGVVEDPTPGGRNFLTSYTYDAVGNLRRVNQGGQLRFFMFDSLGRLIRAKNPEHGNFTPETGANADFPGMTDSTSWGGNDQWSEGYLYDNNGNVIKRKDARNVVTSYGYDGVNRLTTVRYTDSVLGPGNHTKDVDRHYDGAILGKGRFYYDNWGLDLTKYETHTAVDEYDEVGRPKQYRQRFLTNGSWSLDYTQRLSYDLAGNVKTQTYPSGHSVSYTYDAAGRLSAFTGDLGDGVARPYTTGVSYSTFGGIEQEQFGTQTPLYHKLHYNRRGQLFDIRLSTVPWGADQWNWNRGAVVNYFSGNYAWEGDPNTPAGTDNNGNLRRQQSWVPGDDWYNGHGYTQDTFGYDPLDRLTSVSEVHGGAWGQSGEDFKQVYTYDRWGNRTIDAQATYDTNQNPYLAIPEPQFELSPQTNQEVPEPSNRLYAPGDAGRAVGQKLMQYDGAGNLVFDAYSAGIGGGRSYDAESRMVAAAGADGNWDSYAYDADGRRVRRKIANEETWQLYGVQGQLLAEYQAGAAPFMPAKEYGYRSGGLLVTMASGDADRMRRFVKNLYYNCLARDPSATELQDKMNQLAQAGAQGGETQLLSTARSIARGLFESTEYVSRGRTTGQYVTDLYNAYLQRGPDADGLNFWISNTNQNGRGATLNAFEVSTEFNTLSATVYGMAAGGEDQRIDAFVRNFYYGAFQREPTSAEAQQQRQRLNSAAAVSRDQVIAEARAMGVQLIQEANYNAGHTTEQYVADLYQAFLQRAPDGPGLNFWANNTNQNGRPATLDAFRLADEYRELAGTLYRETFWFVPDHLGTPRMVADRTGSLAGVRRHDYLPFGEELYAGMGARTPGQKYSAVDNVRQQFAGKERDNETRLDYLNARYLSPSQGRFINVDPGNTGSHIEDPQSWNGYAYARNNPLLYTDPTGQEYVICDPEGNNCKIHYDDDFRRARRVGESTDYTFTGDGNFYEGGLIYDPQGNVIAQYQQVSIDDQRERFAFAMHRYAVPEKKIVEWLARVQIKIIGTFTGLGPDADQGIDLVEQAISGPCFVAGTQVLTKDGRKSIEEVKEGDEVLSYNLLTRQAEYKEVVRTFVRSSDELLSVKVQGEAGELGVTPNHPFYVRLRRGGAGAEGGDGGQWVGAGALKAGDEVKLVSGGWGTVLSVERRPGGGTVYNFEVADNHNYFVGDSGILVHNQCDISSVVQAIASKFGNLECEDCANAIVEAMKSKGVHGEILELQGGQFITSDSFKAGTEAISTNGRHIGVRIGKLVYDNIHPGGIPVKDWIKDLHTPGGHPHIKHRKEF